MEGRACNLAELEETLHDLTGSALVVHHFATWCDPCEVELPILAGEMASLQDAEFRRVAVAWDLFMTPVEPERALEACTSFLDRLGATFDLLLVYTGLPDELFASQGIDGGAVPFTDVRDREGVVVATFARPVIEEDDRREFLESVRRAASAQRSSS